MNERFKEYGYMIPECVVCLFTRTGKIQFKNAMNVLDRSGVQTLKLVTRHWRYLQFVK